MGLKFNIHNFLILCSSHLGSQLRRSKHSGQTNAIASNHPLPGSVASPFLPPRVPPFNLPDSGAPHPSRDNRAHPPTPSEISSPQSMGQSDCKPLHPTIMFFIRIPKCASTSFVELLHKLTKVNNNYELYFHPSGAFDWDTATMSNVAALVSSKAQPGKKFVYARHFYHVDFHLFGLEDYTYVTLVRNPVSRLVSSYLYYHFSSKAHIQRILNPTHKNESLEECLIYEHDGCKRNLMTKYFCGHMKFCKFGDKKALECAKNNLRAQFVAVGVIEDIDLTLKVFEAVLPDYFHGVDHTLPLLNPNEHHLPLNSTLIELIQDTNSADVELYNYARTLLFQKARSCGVT